MIMNKLAYWTVLLLFSINFFGVNAQSTNANKECNSTFWEISGNGLPQPSYLFGSLHVMPKADFSLTTVMLEKLNLCKLLVLETEVDLPLKVQIGMVKKAKLPKDKPLNTYMPKDQFEAFQHYLLDSLKLKKLKYKMVLKFKPIFAASILSSAFIKDPVSYEMELNKRAKKLKMPVKGLETLDFQLDLLNKISIEEQIAMMYSEGQYKNAKKDYFDLLSLYKSGDLNKLLQISKEDPSFEKYDKEILVNRNADWVPKIEGIIKNQQAFITVGAAHLPGELGVIELLRKQGYTVSPLK
jgi:uncharacterized protein